MKLPQTGGCQCGEIRYEITEEDCSISAFARAPHPHTSSKTPYACHRSVSRCQQPSNFNSAPDAPTDDKGSGKSRVEEGDGERVIHDASRPLGGHQPRIRTASRIEPRNHLIELDAESVRWNSDPDPNGKAIFISWREIGCVAFIEQPSRTHADPRALGALVHADHAR